MFIHRHARKDKNFTFTEILSGVAYIPKHLEPKQVTLEVQTEGDQLFLLFQGADLRLQRGGDSRGLPMKMNSENKHSVKQY